MKKGNTTSSRAARKALVTATHLAVRDLSAQSVMFYTMMAEHIGRGVSDLRAWDLLLRNGPITAGVRQPDGSDPRRHHRLDHSARAGRGGAAADRP
jgi:hypothetical protein